MANLIQPAFYFECKGNIDGKKLVVVEGDDLPAFSEWDYNHDRVMVFFEGKWSRVTAGSERYIFQLAEKFRHFSNIGLRFKYQPEYTVQLSLKRTSGQGLEETWFVRSEADAWRYRSTGSGVSFNKPHVFQVGNSDKFFIGEEKVKVIDNFYVQGETALKNGLISEGVTKTASVVPLANKKASLGNKEFQWESVFSSEIRLGNVLWKSGKGSPEGNIAASVGSIYTRTDGNSRETFYVKEKGSGALGWVAK